MNRPFVNVTIPVYNEEKELAASVRKVVDFLRTGLGYPYEIVIANNGSTDATQAIAERLSREFPGVRVVSLPQSGRGRALKKVWQDSAADILSYMDCDLSTDMAAFPTLIESVIAGGFDVAVGSRLLGSSHTTRGIKREVISRCYNLLVKLLFRTHFSDAQCGFKAITKENAKELLPLIEDNNWFMDTELMILAENLGYRIFDLPVRWLDDPDTRVKIWRDALAALKCLFRIRRTIGQGKYSPLRSARLAELSLKEVKAGGVN